MWRVSSEKGYLSIKGDEVYVVVDPTSVPEDVIDLDFVILTKRPKNKKVVEEILESSKATLVGSPKSVKPYSSEHYVDEVKRVRGLATGLWVANVKGGIVIGIGDSEDYIIIISSKSQRGEAERLGEEIYGRRGRVVEASNIEYEEVG